MNARLLVLAAALALAAPAGAAPPPVAATAYVVVNGATGQVLARSHERRAVPVASITKLMTVLVTLEHARLDEVVTAPAAVASVGESSIDLRQGERLTVRELVEAALIQSANDAAYALADHVGRGDVSRFVALMNRKAHALGLRDTHFVRPDGLDVPGHVSSARDVTLLARVAMQNPVVRAIVRQQTARIAGRRTLHTWNDLLGSFPGVIGVKTGHTEGAGWSEVAAVHGYGFVLYATLLGSPDRARRNADLAALLRWGLDRYRVVPVIAAGRPYAWAETGYGRDRLALVVKKPVLRAVLVDRPLVERVVAPAAVSLAGRGDRLGEVRVYDGPRLVARARLVAARSVGHPGLAGRIEWYASRTLHNLWDLLALASEKI